MTKLFLLVLALVAIFGYHGANAQVQEEETTDFLGGDNQNVDGFELAARGLNTYGIRTLVPPLFQLNSFAEWLNQIQRSVYLYCPGNEIINGLVCDPNNIQRADLDLYFCGSEPERYGLCGAFYGLVANGSQPQVRGVNNAGIPTMSMAETDSMYYEFMRRLCECHCGCVLGCHDGIDLETYPVCNSKTSPGIGSRPVSIS